MKSELVLGKQGLRFWRIASNSMQSDLLYQPANQAASQMTTKKSFWRIIVVAVVLVAAAAGGGIAYFNFFQNSFRKLPEFPAESYFGDFKALSGIHYKLQGKVDASLGWNKQQGRLMAFKLDGDGRRVAVLLPASLNEREFGKGQDYLMEVEVNDNGLIDLIRLQKE